MPRKKMTENTHYKESPYDERIEELALDIEAAKTKANKREHFWRRYAVCSLVAFLALVAWGMKEAGALWHETLGVARLQEERAAKTLKMIGEKDGQIKALKDNLTEKQEELAVLKRKKEETSARAFNSVQAGRKLLRQLARSVGEEEEDTDEWIKKLPKEQARAVREMVQVHDEIMAHWPIRSRKATALEEKPVTPNE